MNDKVHALAAYDWRVAGGFLVVIVAATLWVFGDTAMGINAVWWRSETYAHGLLVGPIAAYLMWQRRQRLVQAAPRVQPLALLVIGTAGALWAVGRLGAIVSFQHFALYGLLLGGAWLVVGNAALRRAAFPLAFLVFAVPFGDFLVVPLQDFTAHFTVAAVRLIGVPIYREGYELALPSGNWRVAEVCSGLRYVMASLVLGVLYAHLMYRSRVRQAVFVLISLIVPVLANGLRAFGVIMLGHYSNMRLAVGVDHLIYGWVFFVVVMMVLFTVGAVWREDQPRPTPSASAPLSESAPESALAATPLASGSVPGALVVLLLGLALLAAWPPAVAWLEARNDHAAPVLSAPQLADWQAGGAPFTPWRPHFESPRTLLTQTYLGPRGPVGLVVAYYNNQAQAGELVSWQNQLVGRGDMAWAQVDHGNRRVHLPDGVTQVRESLIHGSGPSLLVWTWYWTPQRSTASPTLVKLAGALGRLQGRGDDAAQVVLYAPIEPDVASASERLEAFLAGAQPAIEGELASAYRQVATP